MCRRGAIYDARCRPQAARCRPHGQSRVLGGPPRACWVRLRFRPVGLSWCRCVVGAPFMTPVAARRRQDVGRTDSRGCWVGRRGRVGFACGFALSGDGRHKWRPYVWCGGDGVVGRRWWMLGGPPRGVLLESLSFLPRRPSFLPRRPSDRVLRRYGRGSEVHILLYITGVRGKDMCISAR